MTDSVFDVVACGLARLYRPRRRENKLSSTPRTPAAPLPGAPPRRTGATLAGQAGGVVGLDRDGRTASPGRSPARISRSGSCAGSGDSGSSLFMPMTTVEIAAHADVGHEGGAARAGCGGRRSAHGYACRRRGWRGRRRNSPSPVSRWSPRSACRRPRRRRPCRAGRPRSRARPRRRDRRAGP